jgi:hypothetical protein
MTGIQDPQWDSKLQRKDHKNLCRSSNHCVTLAILKDMNRLVKWISNELKKKFFPTTKPSPK